MRPIFLLAGLVLIVAIVIPTITAVPLADADADAEADIAGRIDDIIQEIKHDWVCIIK
jgi:hypothetical protein